MNKNLLKAAVLTALTVSFSLPAMAATFKDVPQDHWAYAAVSSLAEDGIIEGYEDQTFKGGSNVTRYEMAQMIAKAMDKDLNAQQQKTVNKLAGEFSDELRDMGAAVDELKAEQERLTISGDARVRYGAVNNAGDNTDYRVRVNLDGKINDQLSFNTRVSSGNIDYDGSSDGVKLDTANVGVDVLGVHGTLGKQDIFIGTGLVIDDVITGVGAAAGGLNLFYGNQTDEDERIFAAEYKTDIFDGLNVNYIKTDADNGMDKEFYGVNTKIGIAKNVSLNAEYAKEDNSGDEAKAYGVSFDKLGLAASYRDVESGMHTAYSTIAGEVQPIAFLSEGYKGMEYKFVREIAADTTLTLAYQDFENQDGSRDAERTAAYLKLKF